MESRKTSKVGARVTASMSRKAKAAGPAPDGMNKEMGKEMPRLTTTSGILRMFDFSGISWRGVGLISPAFLYAMLLAIIPLISLMMISLWQQSGINSYDKVWDFTNYIRAWNDNLFPHLIIRTIMIAALVTIGTVLISFPAAYYISFYGGENKNTWLFFITLPFWSSYLLRVFSWKIVLGYGGVLDSAWINFLGLFVDGSLDDYHLTFLLYNINAVVITLAHAYAPFAILPIFISLEKIDRSLLEAANDLGDKPWQSFIRVTLPLCFTGIIGASVIVFIPTMGDYVTPKMVGGAEGIMISNQIECMFKTCADWPMGSTLSIITMALGLVCLMFFVGASREVFKRIK
ncbi:MAG: ABC transporter permease [Hydrotalea sp.]|nr:ABC transporter permease [Hydrotalea sp.]